MKKSELSAIAMDRAVKHPTRSGLVFARKRIATFEIRSRTCQEKNRREVREQQKLSETNSNQPKLTETVRQFDFSHWNALEKSAPYTVLHGHCLRGSGTY
jgi:hypothetical protein